MDTTQYVQFEAGVKSQDIRQKLCLSFFAGLAISASISAVAFVALPSNDNSGTNCPTSYITTNTPSPEQTSAISNIRDVFLNTTFLSEPLTSSDTDTLQSAYSVFDDDSDGTWNTDEFTSFASSLSNHSTLFTAMDVDSDNIVSIREMTSYLFRIGGVSHYVMMQRLDDHVFARYGLDERNASSKSQLFHEYVTALYFERVDADRKGYFNLSDFQEMLYARSLAMFDRDGDDYVSFDEFIETQFHASSVATPSSAFKLFRSTLTQNRSQLLWVDEYDGEFVSGLNLTVCPVTDVGEVDAERRRLWVECAWDSLDCGMSAVEAGASCSTAIAADGVAIPDDLECAGKVVDVGHSCYDAYNSCFGDSDDGSDAGSDTSGGSDYYGGDTDSDWGSYGGYYGYGY